ncbi:MAG: hypothetical protein ACRCV9_04965 [Burkholderiaceae bacterium]
MPRGQPGSTQTLRGLFELIGRSYDASAAVRAMIDAADVENARKGSAATTAPKVASNAADTAKTVVRSPSVAREQPPASQSPVPVSAAKPQPAVRAVAPAKRTAVFDVARTVAVKFFGQMPWSGARADAQAQQADSTPQAARVSQSVFGPIDRINAKEFFVKLAWSGAAAATVSIQPSAQRDAGAEQRFGMLPGLADLQTASVSLFKEIPWQGKSTSHK